MSIRAVQHAGVGGGSFLSDTSPEEKAAELRAQSTVHYMQAPA